LTKPRGQIAAADFQRPARGKFAAGHGAKAWAEPGVLVSAGGGDNMMGAIGTGNTRAGRRHRELRHQRDDLRLRGANPWLIRAARSRRFCDSTNRWLPLLCTMNVTVATEMMRQDFG
jgi:xylulokinase